MFKLINKTKHDRRGFTIAELIVAIAIMALVMGLVAQLFGTIYKRYDMVEKQFKLQAQVEYIVAQFQEDATKTSLSTATKVDIFYEEPATVEANHILASCPELGTFTENADGTITFQKPTNQYTYYFTYKGYFYSLAPIHLIDEDNKVTIKSNATAYKFYYQFDNPLKLDVKFSVGVDAFQWDTTENKEMENPTDASGNALKHKYLDSGISVSVKSNREYLPAKYDLNSSFSFDNMKTNGQLVNCNNDSGYYFTSEYTAGWDAGMDTEGYPSDRQESGKTYPNSKRSGNVIRFISYNDSIGGALDADTGDTETAFTCGTRWLMAGTDMESGVVKTLRDFRDNTLKGTYLGDIIIEKYYNEWSPAIIKIGSKNEKLKNIGRTVVTDTAIFIAMVSGN